MARVTPEHIEARKQAILDAACVVFAQKGSGAATMQEIAREVGVSQGTIYLYYPSKADLVRAVCDAKTRGVQALFEEAERTTDEPLAALAIVAQTLAQSFHEESFATDVILSMETTLAGARDPADLGVNLCATSQAIAETIARLIQTAQSRGEIDPTVNPHTLAVVLEAFAIGLQHLHLQTQGILDPEAAFGLVVEMLHRLVPAPSGTTQSTSSSDIVVDT